MKKNNKNIKKNAVVVIAIGKNKMWDIAKKTVELYCKNYKLPLEIILKKKYDINGYNNSFNFFEKNQIYDLFEKYDRILRLDWDLIITPHCPNLFDVVPEDKIGVVFEDVGSRKPDRRHRIIQIQKKLGDLGWRRGYLNSGVVVASKQHKEIFHTTLEDIELIEKCNLKVSKEQTYLNYTIRKLEFKIHNLSFKYNHTSMFSEFWNGFPDKLKSFIIHYAGDKNALKKMKLDYEKIFYNKFDLLDLIKLLKRRIYFILYSVFKITLYNKIEPYHRYKKVLSLLKKQIIEREHLK